VKARNEEKVFFERVFYCGDGDNDFCPSLRLTEKDFAFARKGFELEKVPTNRVRAHPRGQVWCP
jgi:2-hydroxy-3-keto-5-methylthiopentenyl-1-phosphate phosphatase